MARLYSWTTGATVTDTELVALCSGKIAGKIEKFKMREISIAELGLADAASMRTPDIDFLDCNEVFW